MLVYDKITKVWSGPKVPSIYNPEQSVGQLILRVLEQTPDVVTQISADTDVSVTCGEMRERMLKIAAHISSLGLEQGDVVGAVAANTENLAPAIFACVLLGFPVNPLSPIMVESDIVQMYSKTKPKIIFCDGSNLDIVQSAVKALKSEAKIYTVMEEINGYESVTSVLRENEIATSLNCPKVDSDATLAILCSSGSTDTPKAIVKSHKNIILECYPECKHDSDAQNTLFQYSAIFWYSGFSFLIKSVLYKYKRILTTTTFDPDFMINVINKYQVTHTLLPPYAIANLLQLEGLRPFTSIKCWIVGGSTVSKELCEKFSPFIPNGIICVVYACTEQALLTINKSGCKYASSGTPMRNLSLKIVDDNDNTLDNGERGEICVRSTSKFHGYLNEPEKTSEVYGDEWFKTGDIGYFDNDGYIYIVDRKKELLKYQNYQVTPSEIEAIIGEIGGVVSSCVVGVLEKKTGNDIIHAFVIVNESSGLTEERVLKYVNEKVMEPKRIRGGVHFVKSFPVGLTGKINKIEMRKIAAELEKSAS